MAGWWLAAFEVWAIRRLLQSQKFHQTVHNLNRRYNRIRHGTPMEEMGGTKRDNEAGSFFKHFKEELKLQLRGEEKKRRP